MLAEFITVNDRLEILERKLEITNNEIADLKQTIENVERKIKHQKKTVSILFIDSVKIVN
jgi:hypothetical protein